MWILEKMRFNSLGAISAATYYECKHKVICEGEELVVGKKYMPPSPKRKDTVVKISWCWTYTSMVDNQSIWIKQNILSVELELDEMVLKMQRKSLQSYNSLIIMAHNHQLFPLQPEAAEWLNGWTGYISLSSCIFGLDSKGKQKLTQILEEMQKKYIYAIYCFLYILKNDSYR